MGMFWLAQVSRAARVGFGSWRVGWKVERVGEAERMDNGT